MGILYKNMRHIAEKQQHLDWLQMLKLLGITLKTGELSKARQ